MVVINKNPRVDIRNLGMFIRVIQLDFKPKNDQELVELISTEFSVSCTEEDLEEYRTLYEHYQEIYQEQEDFELESRRHQFFRSLNPFI